MNRLICSGGLQVASRPIELYNQEIVADSSNGAFFSCATVVLPPSEEMLPTHFFVGTGTMAGATGAALGGSTAHVHDFRYWKSELFFSRCVNCLPIKLYCSLLIGYFE